jgi:PTH1 family peptidyl-tRNA hydrolase
VVGLGNPGPRYERTRHNAGFMAIDELAARTRAAGRVERDAWLAETTLAGEPALLVKPQSFMNLSGEPVARLLAEAGASPADLVVIVDDVALPLGRLRVRPAGSDGGHNGLRSIASSLDTDAFARVRIGVGQELTPPPEREAERDSLPRSEGGGVGGAPQHPPHSGDLADFVLGEFQPDELPKLREVIDLAADAVACLVQEGVAEAMNRFNGRRAPSTAGEPGVY